MNLNQRKNGRISMLTIILLILLVACISFGIFLLVRHKNNNNLSSNNKNNEISNTEKTNNTHTTNDINNPEYKKKIASIIPKYYCDRIFDGEEEKYCYEEVITREEFLMPIEDIFTITGKGTCATGKVESGTVNVGDTIEIVGMNKKTVKTKVTGIEILRKNLYSATAVDNVGILLENVNREDVLRGQVLSKVGFSKPYTEFEAEMYFSTIIRDDKIESIEQNFRGSFHFRTTDIEGTITEIQSEKNKIYPGNIGTVKVKLNTAVALEEDLKFTIHKDGNNIGFGKITKIIE